MSEAVAHLLPRFTARLWPVLSGGYPENLLRLFVVWPVVSYYSGYSCSGP